jgi:proline dehydrogenase
VEEYIKILDRINETGINSNVSVKLTQLGLDVSRELCYENTRQIVENASNHTNFVRIDMEDSTKTGPTIDVFKRLRDNFDNVGIVIQSYLYRSENDLRDLLSIGARVRLCKGAYDEPPLVAFADKADTDANFIRLMKMLLSSGIYHGIATHDEKMIAATKQFAAEQDVAPDKFEFQMLFGVRRDLQEQLVAEGFRIRVYVPYGKYWYPYFMRRLAERPANLWFVLKNMLKG